MAKASRSPVLGYNHNVRYHGRVYHVQTEDSGPGHSRIFTHLFFEGTIMASKRLDYGADELEDTVKSLMQSQHKAILKELKQGAFDAKIQGFFGSLEVPSLDAELLAIDVPVADPLAIDAAVADPFDVTLPDATLSRAEVLEVGGPLLPFDVPMAEPLPPAPLAVAIAIEAEPRTEPQTARRTVTPPPLPPGVGRPIPPLDLDNLPPLDADEPTLPPVIVDAPPPANPHGLGVYSMKGATRDRPFETPAQGAPVRRPTPEPPPVASRPPVVVIRPPARRPVPRPAASPPPGGVIVQRTVVVGVGNGPGGQRPRRPRPAVPYVVKEGSHPIVQNPRAAQVAPPVPSSLPSPPASAPPQATISDKSLDEVILAYLSQDTEPKPR